MRYGHLPQSRARDLIPIAACYRRLNELQALGVVYVERELPAGNGKPIRLYRSRLRSVRVTFEGGRVRAHVVVAAGPAPGSEPRVSEAELRLDGGSAREDRSHDGES